MKKTVLSLIPAALLLAICVLFASCSSSSSTDSIAFGKKYGGGEGTYYVFNSDKTGYYECHYTYESPVGSEYSYTASGRVDFEWREASNGAIYLFEIETTYNDDNTEGRTISVIDDPIYFGDEFFTYTYSNQYGSTTVCIPLEGSEMEKILKE